MIAMLKNVLVMLLAMLVPALLLWCGWQARGIYIEAQTAKTVTTELEAYRSAANELLEATRTATESSQATIRNSRAAAANLRPVLEAAGLGDDHCPVPAEQRVRSVQSRQAYNVAAGRNPDGSAKSGAD